MLSSKKKFRLILPVTIFFAIFLVYIYTLCPTVCWDDAGELIVACYTLGIPHPPGHPLYTLLGWLFTRLPFGSPAYGVNLLSAFFGALTCALVFQVVREMALRESTTPSRADFAAAVAALGAGFSPLLWDQSVVAETTTLHTFFMMLVTLLIFRICAEPEHPDISNRLMIFSFIYGLSFTNHVAALFFMPSLMLILFLRFRWNLFRPVRFFAMAGLFFLALSVYAYLPIRSHFDPALDWGNPENLHNFLWVVTAKQYRANLWQTPTWVGLMHGLRNMGRTILSNFAGIGLIFLLAGMWRSWKKRKLEFIYSLLIIGVLFFVTLNSAFISAYLAPAILLMMIWVGFGIAGIEQEYFGRVGPRKRKAATAALILASTAFVFASFLSHFPQCNKREYRFAEQYGKNLLSSLPQNSLLMTGSADPLFISWYLQICENYRTDVKIITRNGMIRPGYLDQVRREYPELEIPVEFQIDEKEVQSAKNTSGNDLPWYARAYFRSLYELNFSRFPVFWEGYETNQILRDRFVPYLYVFSVLPPGVDPASNMETLLDFPMVLKEAGDDEATRKVYGNHILNYALYYQSQGDIEKALRYYDEALTLNPVEIRALNNKGVILAEKGKEEEALACFLTAFRSNPIDVVTNHNLGQALIKRNHFREAAPFFYRAVKFEPTNFEDVYNLGLCYASLGKNQEAKELFAESLHLRPDSPMALSSLGLTFLRQQNLKEAEPLLKAATMAEPVNAENWYNLACLQAMKKDTAASKESLKKALALDAGKTTQLAAHDTLMSPLLDSLTQ